MRGVHSTFVKHPMDALNGGAAIAHMLPLATALIGALSFQFPHQAYRLACVLGDFHVMTLQEGLDVTVPQLLKALHERAVCASVEDW